MACCMRLREISGIWSRKKFVQTLPVFFCAHTKMRLAFCRRAALVRGALHEVLWDRCGQCVKWPRAASCQGFKRARPQPCARAGQRWAKRAAATFSRQTHKRKPAASRLPIAHIPVAVEPCQAAALHHGQENLA